MSVGVSEKVESFFAKYPQRTYTKGQVLIHAGDEPTHIYFLEAGKVRQYDISYRGDDIVVNIFKPGAFFPMLWAVTNLPNKYFFDTESDVQLRVAPAKEVVTFLKDEPEVLYDLLSRVYSGLDGILGRMVHLMSGSAKSRVLYELIIESRRFGEIATDGSCLIGINEGSLAARAGLSRETVSREMQKISKDGLVTVSHSGILIRNIDKLEKQFGGEV